MKSLITTGLAALTFALALAPPTLAQERQNTILVLDASGSMWGQIDGVNKITIAREVVADILAEFPADQNLGFVAFGHRERGQCSDIQTLVPPAPGSADQIIGIVEALNPRGMTPMTDAVIAAAQALRHTEQAATVILVSDGIETCNPDPCAAARALEAAGVDFTAHVIGFDVSGEAEALMQMQCIAEETGGRFLTADNAQELSQALREVTATLMPVPFTFTAHLGTGTGGEPVWERHSTPPDLSLLPGEVVWEISDSAFNILQTGNANPFTAELPFGDYIVTVHWTVRETFSQADLSLTAETGRDVHVFFPAPAPREPPAQVFAPTQVVVGSAIPVTWQAEGLHPRDYVTIVPAEAPDGTYGRYDRIEGQTQGELRAPSEPGLYEVRLHLDVGDRVMARTPIEVVEGQPSLDGPDRVRAGSEITVSWTGVIHPRDYVAIVPIGTPDGEQTGYRRVGETTGNSFTAPAAPGLYEIRYHLDQGDRVMARRPIEVLAADAPMDAGADLIVPASARPGESIVVRWTGGGDSKDLRIAIARADQSDFSWISFASAVGTDRLDIAMPESPGTYEIRYLDISARAVLGRALIEVRP